MLVREIMTAPALHVRINADLDEALQIMAGKRVTALPVVDAQHRLVGVLSEIDLLRRAIEPDHRAQAMPVQDTQPLPKTVAEVMTVDPRTTTEGADVADLIELFTEQSFKSLPVVRGDKLIGIISRSDVVRALWRSDEELLDELHSAFQDYSQQDWKVTVTNGVVQVEGSGSARDRDVATAIARSVLGVRRVHVPPSRQEDQSGDVPDDA